MIGSEVEFRCFTVEINSVERHQKNSNDTRDTYNRRECRRFRREYKSPQYQKRREQRANGDEDYMETA
jgi:hypothetical protein